MTPEQLKEAILSAPCIATTFKNRAVDASLTDPVEEIRYVQLQPGNTPACKIFAVYVTEDYANTARLFVTNTGARSYVRYLATLKTGELPTNIEEWGWANLELTQQFKNKAAF